MKTFFAATLAASALAFNGPEIVSDANGYAQLNIKEDGKDKTVYIASPSWFTGGGGDTLSLPEGGRVYLSNTPELSSEGFYKPALLGGAVEYDVDMSQMECGCIAAFYLVRMPAHDWSGNLDKTDGFWYCDANQVDGEYCPEFDIMEANKYAFQTTAHPCSTPYNGHYDSNCEHGGLTGGSLSGGERRRLSVGKFFLMEMLKMIASTFTYMILNLSINLFQKKHWSW